jgi:hypothetical protein
VSASCCACLNPNWWWLGFKPKHVVIHVFNKARWNIVANERLLYSLHYRKFKKSSKEMEWSVNIWKSWGPSVNSRNVSVAEYTAPSLNLNFVLQFNYLGTAVKKKKTPWSESASELYRPSLGTAVTNQNLIQEEIKRRLNSGNACYHSVRDILPSGLLSRNIGIRICKIIFFARCFVWVWKLVSDIMGGT